MIASRIPLVGVLLTWCSVLSGLPQSGRQAAQPGEEISTWRVEVSSVTWEGAPLSQTVTGREFISYDAQFLELGQDAGKRTVVWVRRRITKWTKTAFGREEAADCPMIRCCVMLQDSAGAPVEGGDWATGEFALLDLDPLPWASAPATSSSVERLHPGLRSWYRCPLRREATSQPGDASRPCLVWKSSEPGKPVRDDWSALMVESAITMSAGVASAITRVATETTSIPGLADTPRTESTLRAARIWPAEATWTLATGPEDRARACGAVRRFLDQPTESLPARDEPPTTQLLKEVAAWRRDARAQARTKEKDAGVEEALRHRLVGRALGPLSGTWSDAHDALPERGRRMVLLFWADWCGPCCAELRHYDSQLDLFARSGVDLIPVNREKDLERQRKRLAAMKLRIPSLLSAEDMFTRFRIEGIPVTVMVAADGRIADVVFGFSKPGAARTIAWVTGDAK